MNDELGCEVPAFNASADEIAGVLKTARAIAVVGLSPKPERPSHQVAAYLRAAGYRIIPVNPNVAEVFGEKSYPALDEVPGQVDVVQIFRRPDAVPEIVEKAVRRGAKTVWMQTGIVNNAAAEAARSAGLHVVMNRCMMAEHQRFTARGRGKEG